MTLYSFFILKNENVNKTVMQSDTMLVEINKSLKVLSLKGHLHDDVFLLRPEFTSFFLSYLNLVMPVRLK